jgi:Protein of unknown function (DUF4244)
MGDLDLLYVMISTRKPRSTSSATSLIDDTEQKAIGDAGMTTAEYAVGTVAAVAFAAVLYKIIQSGPVQSALSDIVTSALHVSL